MAKRQLLDSPGKKLSFWEKTQFRLGGAIQEHRFLLATLGLAVVAALPLLWGGGLLNTRGGGDSPFLLQRLQQLETAVFDGHFPARWMPDANYGYGYPFYNFYAPLSIYITLVFRLIGFSYVHAIQLAQLAGFVVAAWGMFELGKRWFGGQWAGLITAVSYTLAPFHMVNVYVRGDSLAEFWAMAFYPWVILTAENLCRQPNRKQTAWFALAYAALLLSHNISALIFTPFLLLFFALHSPFTIQNSLFTIGGLLLALGLAAWFFVPALAERELAQLGPVTTGYFHFSNHFRGWDLIQSSFLFNYNPDGGVAFRMGLVQAGTAVLGLNYLLRLLQRRPVARPVLFILLTVLIATVMITPASRWAWDNLPLLDFTQFPWRFLSVQAFGTALATAVLGRLPRPHLVVPGVVALWLVAALGGLQLDYLPLTDEDVTAEKLAQYEWFTGNIGTTVSAEYLPPTFQPRPYTSAWLNTGQRWQVWAVSGDVKTAELLTHSTTSQTWQLESTAGATVRFPTMAWAGWLAEVDGTRVEIRPSAGLISLDVPPGQHTIHLRLTRTPIRLAAELVSAIALLITLWLLSPNLHSLISNLPKIAVPILLSVFLHFWPTAPLPASNLTWDFAQMGYLHHNSQGVLFENGARLLAYQFEPEQVEAGETLQITLEWETAESMPPTLATLALTSPAANRPLNNQTAITPITSAALPIQAGQAVYQLPIPTNAPTGLFVPQVILEEADPLMPSGNARGTLFLRPIRITASPAISAQNNLDVQAVQVQARADDALDIQLTWQTPAPPPNNYNVSLRLTDAAGLELAQFDTQPGFGFLPSSLWLPGTPIHDWLTLPLPDTLPDSPYYPLVARLYDPATGTVALTRRLGQMVWQNGVFTFLDNQPIFTVPDTITPLTAEFRDETGSSLIQLHGYVVLQTPAQLELYLYWGALGDGRQDYTRFVHLIDAATDAPPVRQDDAAPRYGSYPTSQWVAGEVVDELVKLDLTGLPAGQYEVVVGFYRQVGQEYVRLTAVSANGTAFPDGQVTVVPMIVP